MFISLYRSFTSEPEFLSVKDALELVKQCPELKAKTLKIQDKHAAGIIDGFATISKASYQADKRNLPFVCFAGNVYRGKDQDNKNYIDTGIMNFDFDGTGVLADQRKLLNSLPFCHSTGLSVSGYVTGAFWGNIAVEIPKHQNGFKTLPDNVKRAFSYNDNLSYFESCTRLRKLFYQVIKHQFKTKKNIDAGSKGGSCNDTRYLTYDQTLFINPDFEYFTIEQAAGYWFDEMKGTKAGAVNRNLAASINTNDAFVFCTQYATGAGYSLTPGHIHNYCTNFAIASNLLGIPEQETTNYLNAISPKKITGNPISYPYEKYKKHFGVWSYRIKKATRNIYHLSPGQKLSSLNLVFENCVINAPTGSGKTYALLSGAGFVVLVVPDNVLLQNVLFEYPDLIGWNAATKQESKAVLHRSKKIVTNVQNLKSLINHLGEKTKKYKLVVDEYQYLSTATGKEFMYNDYQFLCNSLDKFKSVVFMSGTAVYLLHPKINCLPVIEITSRRDTKTATVYNCFDSIYQAANIANEATRAGMFPIILLDNKGATRAKLLSYLKFVPDLISSDEKPDYLKTGNIPKNVKGLLSTSAMTAGNNIKNPEHFVFIVLGHHHHHSTIEQLASRSRNALSVHVHILRGETSLKCVYGFDPARDGEKHQQYAAAGVNYFNMGNVMGLDGFKTGMQIRQKVKENFVIFDDQQQSFDIDYLGISNAVIRRETSQEYYNTDYLISKLKQYNFVFNPDIVSDLKPGIGAKKEATRSGKEAAGNIAVDYRKALDTISDQANPEQYCREKIKEATGAEKKALQRYLVLSCKMLNTFEVLQSIGVSGAKYNLLTSRIKVRNYQLSESYRKQKSDISKFTKLVVAGFSGAVLLPDEIKHKFLKCLVVAGFDRETIKGYEAEKQNSRILKVLRFFFDITSKATRTDQAGFSRKYRFVSPFSDNIKGIKPLLVTQTRPEPENCDTIKRALALSSKQKAMF